jgi:hypothetical protein
MHQGQDTDDASILFGPNELGPMAQAFGKDRRPLRAEMETVISPFCKVLVPSGRGARLVMNES